MQKPVQGANVIWTDGAKDYAATIVRVHPDGRCDLSVLLDDVANPHTLEPGYLAFKRNVLFSEAFWPATDGFRPDTWHYSATPVPKNAAESLV